MSFLVIKAFLILIYTLQILKVCAYEHIEQSYIVFDQFIKISINLSLLFLSFMSAIGLGQDRRESVINILCVTAGLTAFNMKLEIW